MGSATDTIAGDRPCHRCGYSLRGLPAGGACPECGTAIRRGRRSGLADDSLTGAPLHELKWLASGLLLMAACGIGAAVALQYARGPSLPGSAWSVALCSAWWVGVWIVTRPRPHTDATVPDPVLDSAAMRTLIRVSQLAWVATAAAFAFAAFWPALTSPGAVPPLGPAPGVAAPLPAPELWARRAAMVFEPIGFLSAVPLSIFLAAMAEWAGETGLAERFRISAWGVAVGGVIGLAGAGAAAAGGQMLGPVLFGGGVLAMGVATLAQVLFIASLVQLAHSAVWAISNAHQRLVVEDRMMRREEGERRQMVRRVEASDEARAAPARAASLGPANQPVLERPRGGAEPYGLEPDA